MPTLCLPGPGTQDSVLFRKQIVSSRDGASFFLTASLFTEQLLPFVGRLSGIHGDGSAASEPVGWWGLLICN